MAAKLESEDGRALHKPRRRTVEPVFGIIEAALGFTNLSPRGLDDAADEWNLVAPAHNRKRLRKLEMAS